MAYDPNSAYQAPGRAYYGQMQNGYMTQAQAQYSDFSVQQPYDEPFQGYDQPYASSNGYSDPRAVQSPQSPQASSHNAYYDNQRNARSGEQGTTHSHDSRGLQPSNCYHSHS